MLTPFGKALRMIRLERGELLKTMADRLSVTSAYLSAIENGKRNLTDSLYDKIITNYNLSDIERKDLENAYAATADTITVNLSQVSDEKRQLGLVFARKFDTLSSDEVDTLRKILNNTEDS